MPNPFGFAVAVSPQQQQQYKNANNGAFVPFGMAAPKSKAERIGEILKPYVTGPVDAFWGLMNSPFALGFDPTEQDAANGLAAAGGAMMAGSVVPKPANALNMGIRAFHGSPHSFDKFDMSKIGTGEGAQAYGHGLYFAESEGVAKSYRDALSGKQYTFNKDPSEIAAKHGQSVVDTVYNYEGDPKEINNVISGLREAVKRNLAEFGVSDISQLKPMYDGDLASSTIKMAKNADALEASIKSGDIALDPGSMYEVNINADPNAFLDWDKPFANADELERFAARFDAVDPTIRKRIEDWGYERQQAGQPMPDGNDLVREVFGGIGTKEAQRGQQMMKEAGIPGIKYLDAGSRGKGDGTRNYVVFDDKLIEIVRKYGIAGASAMLGYNILDGMDSAQADELKRIEGNQ